MQQAIRQRRGQRGILRKGRIPLPKRQIARDDQRTPLVPQRDFLRDVAGGNDLEEQISLLAGHRQLTIEAFDLTLGARTIGRV